MLIVSTENCWPSVNGTSERALARSWTVSGRRVGSQQVDSPIDRDAGDAGLTIDPGGTVQDLILGGSELPKLRPGLLFEAWLGWRRRWDWRREARRLAQRDRMADPDRLKRG